MRDRSWRRAQRALAVERARGRARLMSAGGMEPMSDRWIRKSAVTPHPCSGWCCGNPRDHGEGGRLGEGWPRAEEIWD